MKTNPLFRTLFALVLITLFSTRTTTAQEWKQLGPWGGAVDGIAGDTNLLLAGNDRTRIFASRDGGITWSLLMNSTQVFFSGHNVRFYDGKIFIFESGIGGNNNGFYSADSGASFQSYHPASPGPVMKYNGMYYLSAQRYLGSADGLTYGLSSDPGPWSFHLLGAVGQVWYGYKETSQDSIFISSNQGQTWLYKSKLSSNTLHYYSLITSNQWGKDWFFNMGPNVLFIKNASSTSGFPFFKSTDGGTTWTTPGNGLPGQSSGFDPYTHIGQVLFTANGNGVFRSTDLGESWEGVNTPVPGASIKSIYRWKNRLLIGTDFGIYYSDDLGNEWTASSTGIQTEDIVDFSCKGANIYAGTESSAQGLYRRYTSTDGGGTWEQNGGLNQKLINSFYYGDTIIARTYGSNTYHYLSADHGQTFQQAAMLDVQNPQGVFGNGKALYTLGAVWNAGTSTTDYPLLRSTNFGQSWDTVYTNIAGPGYQKMAGKGNLLYLFSTSDGGGNTDFFIRSADNGVTWSQVALPSSFNGLYIKEAVIKGDSIFLITTSTTTPAFRSYNRGQTWTPLFQVGGASTATLHQLRESRGVLYLSSSNGIFRSTNWGGGWSSVKGNFPFNTNGGLITGDMDIKGDSLIVSVYYFGLWYTSLCSAKASAPNLTPCAGGNLQLLASGGTSYSWTGPGGFSSLVANPLVQNISAAGSGNYIVTVNTPGGCVIKDTVTIAVQPGAGTLALTASTVCAGQNLSLGVTGGTGTYQWTGPGGFSSTLQNPVRDSVTAADSGNYTVTVTAGNGCTSTKSIYVAVPYLPRANMKPVENRNPCAMDTVWLEPAFLPSGVQYQWYRNNVAIAGATNATYGATTSGTYHFLYLKGGCQSAFFDEVLLTFSGFRQPRRPVLTITPPPSGCLEQFTIQSTTTGSYGRKWYKNGVEISGATASSYSTNVLATYRLRVDTTGDCVSWSAPVTVQLEGTPPFVAPQIDAATVRLLPGNSMRCAVEWKRNDPLSSLVQHVVILRQSDTQAGQYDSVGVASNTDTAWVDLTADPVMRPYFYKLQARAVCSPGVTYLSAPSSHHKTIHLQISQPPMGNLYNLLWTGYEGFAVSSYKIYRGLDFINTSLLTTVAGNITSYTDAPPTTDTYFYRVEAETNDAYFPWGRIAAFAVRTTKSNTRPSTQSIVGGDSTSIYNVTDVAERIVTRGSFTLYPSPSPSGMCMLKSGNAISEVTILDALGRNIPVSILKESETLWSIRMERPANGLYLVKVKDSSGLTNLKWVVGE